MKTALFTIRMDIFANRFFFDFVDSEDEDKNIHNFILSFRLEFSNVLKQSQQDKRYAPAHVHRAASGSAATP
uniref:Uncharacterized protein n=1 Tax=Romanomermis culicivorax TaxID=13658 RepID=A0A915I0D8_ROMCU